MSSQSEVAAAMITIGANMGPLNQALGGLGSTLTAPLSGMSNFVSAYLTKSLETSMASLKSVLGGDPGGVIKHIGDALSTGLGASMKSVLTTVLGDTIGGALGSALQTGLDLVNKFTFQFAGNIVSAFTGPVRQAFAASLTDFDYWVQKAMAAENVTAKFSATLKASGGVAGYTREQLSYMAQGITESSAFGKRQVEDAMASLLRMDQIRGNVFAGAMSASVSLAAVMGTDLTQAAHMMGRALENPEHGLQMLRRAGLIFTKQQNEVVAAMAKAGNVAGAQSEILRLVKDRYGAVGQEMGEQLPAKLTRLSNIWEQLGESMGGVLTPLTELVTDMATAVVRAFAGGAIPAFQEMKKAVQGFADGVRSWLKENSDTFERWGGLVKVIIENVGQLVREGFGRLFGSIDQGKVQSFWETFRDGVDQALARISVFTSSFDLIQDGAKLAFLYVKDQILSFIETAKTNWRSWLDDAFKTLVEWGTKIGSILKALLIEAVDAAAAAAK